ncbi:penicillin-binding protein activator [Candidatus Symbiopectobacterium sp. 'North America']|uniref:penicillin-binding protein activator n=1 Tax=Candidatus Symbiopectobacterium sp. 'North America' TaxID=2794574 RepID=UPI0018CBE046|nr:penicillin-binding protein activator [Candidatus Symbiopectobacterium sp. 'North America']MBG6246467.1 penicillin-binding protein activator [Candidatus Symbiopectobacterium sp. 'North America']
MLPNHFVRSQTGRIASVLFAALLLAGCPGQAPQPPSPDVQGQAGASSYYYLQQMEQSRDNNKAGWQLLAIRALVQEGKLPQATEQFNALPAQLAQPQQREQQLLKAEIAASNNDSNGTTAALQGLDVSALSADQQARYYQAQINAHQGQPSADLLRAYIAQEPQLKGDEHQKNIDWVALTQMSAQAASSVLINANENVLAGWMDLLTTYQNNRESSDQLKAALSDWQTRYPRHPTAQTLPTPLASVQTALPVAGGSIGSGIALLLPLNGQAQVFANAIQLGFNAAKSGQSSMAYSAPADTASAATDNGTVTSISAPYATPASVSPTSEAASGVSVKVYDTTSQPVANLVAQAQKDGASLIVGPLLKNNVEQLTSQQTTVNILALNQPEHVQNTPNMCFFALSPEDEASDAAQFIHRQGKQQPLLLVPRGALGDRVINAFAQAWQSQGGNTLLQQRFGNTAELKQAINSGAGLSLNGQPVNVMSSAAQPGTTIGGLTIPAQIEPTVSGNVDAVYILATPDELALIKPMIDMRTTSQSRPALYASSRSFQAGLGPDFRLEMEGLQFSEIPLLAGSNPALMQQVVSQFKNDYSLVRLYAMGMDAWALANHFTDLLQSSSQQITGATGTLTASADCVINRQLTWLQYRQGQLVPVP